MKLRNIAAAAIFSAVSFAASAQTAPSTLPNDNARIHQGVRSGELTPAERAKLKTQEAGVRGEKQEARADGHVTPAEHKVIRHDKRKLSRNIYRQKHDAQVRP